MKVLMWPRFRLLPEMLLSPETSLFRKDNVILFSDTQVSVAQMLYLNSFFSVKGQ